MACFEDPDNAIEDGTVHPIFATYHHTFFHADPDNVIEQLVDPPADTTVLPERVFLLPLTWQPYLKYLGTAYCSPVAFVLSHRVLGDTQGGVFTPQRDVYVLEALVCLASVGRAEIYSPFARQGVYDNNQRLSAIWVPDAPVLGASQANLLDLVKAVLAVQSPPSGDKSLVPSATYNPLFGDPYAFGSLPLDPAMVHAPQGQRGSLSKSTGLVPRTRNVLTAAARVFQPLLTNGVRILGFDPLLRVRPPDAGIHCPFPNGDDDSLPRCPMYPRTTVTSLKHCLIDNADIEHRDPLDVVNPHELPVTLTTNSPLVPRLWAGVTFATTEVCACDVPASDTERQSMLQHYLDQLRDDRQELYPFDRVAYDEVREQKTGQHLEGFSTLTL